jgi:hypothetical protein
MLFDPYPTSFSIGMPLGVSRLCRVALLQVRYALIPDGTGMTRLAYR